jgi:beta-lactamase class A
MNTVEDIRAQFASAGVRGWLHARSVEPDATTDVALDADAPVVMASVYKLPVLVAFCRAVDEGHLDPAEPVRLLPSQRTPGITGVAGMSDPVVMSRRDLARSMITVSDNAAGDALLDALTLQRVNHTLLALGLSATRVQGGTRDIHRTLTQDTGALDLPEAMEMLRDNDRLITSTAFDPLLSSATTARDMTSLLAAIWTDTAASPQQCHFMRTVLSQQVWPHRLSSGFSYSGVRVAGKTGTLGALRHEVGVIHHQHEPAITVAVLTQAARADQHLPRVDAVIGTSARTAVTALR